MASSGESSAPDGGGEVKPSPAKPCKVRNNKNQNSKAPLILNLMYKLYLKVIR